MTICNQGEMMEKFIHAINQFVGVDNYFDYYENPNVNGSGPALASEVVFAFTYLRLIDSALKHSKKEILKNNGNPEKIMNEVAVYPNGDTLGFYNTSEYDMETLVNCRSEKECSEKLRKYIGGFSENIKKVFDKLYFDFMDFLAKAEITRTTLEVFQQTALNDQYFSSHASFMKVFTDFISIMAHDEVYSMYLGPIANEDVSSSYNYIHETVKEYGSFLNSLLLCGTDFENYETLNIYDPDSSGAYILNETKDEISKDFDVDVRLYGKAEKTENEMIHLAKTSVLKRDSYDVDGATILDISEDILSIDDIDSYGDFDLIVSNYMYNDLTEHEKILEFFKGNSNKATKLVIALNSFDDFIGNLSQIVDHDNLEAIISFKYHYIIIANSDKPQSKIGHFLLIDESESGDTESIADENMEMFSNNMYDVFRAHHMKKLTEYDREKMKSILDSYAGFEASINSILIENDDYDEEMIRILLN